MGPELIIVIVVGLIGLYIFVQLNITSKKIKSKASAKPVKKDDKVELKTVIAPKPDPVKLEKDTRLSEDELMRKAALESIEDEKRWKESIRKSEELKLETKSTEKQSELDKKLKEMQAKLNQMEFTKDEQDFVDEVSNLNPQLKAVLFAELLRRKNDY